MSTFQVELLSVTQVAERLGLTTARIRQMLAADLIHGQKLGTSYWVVPSYEVDRIEQERTEKRGQKKSG